MASQRRPLVWLTAALLLVWATGASAQQITGASPDPATLVPGGDPVTVTLSGSSLQYLTGPRVLQNGRLVSGITATLPRGGFSLSRPVVLVAEAGTPDMTGLELVFSSALSPRSTITTPLDIGVRSPKPNLVQLDVPELIDAGRSASENVGTVHIDVPTSVATDVIVRLDGPGSPYVAVHGYGGCTSTVGSPACFVRIDPGATSGQFQIAVPALLSSGAWYGEFEVWARSTDEPTIANPTNVLRRPLNIVSRLDVAPSWDGVHTDYHVPAHVSTTATGRLRLNVPAPPGGFDVQLDPIPGSQELVGVVTSPGSVTVPGGSDFTTFQVRTSAVDLTAPGDPNIVEGGVRILATVANVSMRDPAFLNLLFERPPEVSEVAAPSGTSVTGGTPLQLTVRLAHASGATEPLLAPLDIQLTSSNPQVASVPPAVAAATGATEAAFSVETFRVRQPAPVTITATDGRQSHSITITVEPCRGRDCPAR